MIYYFSFKRQRINSIERVGIVASKKGLSGDIKIPSKVEIEGKNYLVSSICTYAFYNRDITSVVIPESVRFVAGHSFKNCKNLETVIIKEGFVRIMTEAFDEGVELIILKKE